MSRSFLVTCVLFGLLTHGGFVFGQQMDLVGHWPLDEGAGTTAADVSGNGHAGTLMGDPQWTQGVYEGALDLDGVSDFVEIALRDIRPFPQSIGRKTDFIDAVSIVKTGDCEHV